MSWDEALFAAAFDGAKRWFSPTTPDEVLARRVDLAPEQSRLEVLARLLTGAPVSLSLCDDVGGYRGDVIFLPRFFDAAPTLALNQAAAVARLAWACSSRALAFTCPASMSSAQVLLATALAAVPTRQRLLDDAPMLAPLLPRLERVVLETRPRPPDTEPAAQALEALVRFVLGGERDRSPECGLPDAAWAWADIALKVAHGLSAPTLRQAMQSLPAPESARGRRWLTKPWVVPGVWLWGELMSPGAERAVGKQTKADASALPGGTEVKKKVVTQAQRVEEPKNELEENPLVHSFEKVHTLEAYKGGSKRIDGDDELEAHQKALDDVDLRQMVRSHQKAHSVYRADAQLDGSVGDADDEAPGAAEFTYDEWDERRGEWRRDWCHLSTQAVPVVPEQDDALKGVRSRLQKTTAGLRAVFEQVEASRSWRLRQPQGPDVDVDAMVARYGALKAGHCSDGRVYAARRRHSRSTAVLVLLDASLSTDAWVNNRRVIDVEREAVIALGDALDGLFDEVAVGAFCSQTRQDCRFLMAKDFSESWAMGARRVMSLNPAGFTRIGPALRHGTKLLMDCGARKKLLLLVSDGKPSDLDRYEGRYGVADIHRAVLDAHGQGVVTHALAVDPSAKAWLPSMFGASRASVVERPDDLVDVLARVTTTALK